MYAVRGAEFDKLYDQLPPKLKEYIEERELDEQFPLKAAQKNPEADGLHDRITSQSAESMNRANGKDTTSGVRGHGGDPVGWMLSSGKSEQGRLNQRWSARKRQAGQMTFCPASRRSGRNSGHPRPTET